MFPHFSFPFFFYFLGSPCQHWKGWSMCCCCEVALRTVNYCETELSGVSADKKHFQEQDRLHTPQQPSLTDNIYL